MAMNTELLGVKALVDNKKVIGYRYEKESDNRTPTYVQAGGSLFYKIVGKKLDVEGGTYDKVKDLVANTFKMVPHTGHSRRTGTIGSKNE